MSEAVRAPRPAAERRKPSRLETLVRLEGELRGLRDAQAVEIYSVNEGRALLGFSQAFFVRFDRRGRGRITALSGMHAVDRNAPTVRAFEAVARRMAGQNGGEGGWRMAALDEVIGPSCDEEMQGWPFRNLLWLPMRDRDGKLFAGLLLARGDGWEEADAVIGERFATAVAHSLMAITPPALLRRLAPPKWLMWGLPLALLLLLLIPVPMTAIAPVEVVADDPFVVAAPIDGVIADVVKRPNETVRSGEVLFVYDDTRLRSEAEVAARREQVAHARLETLKRGAFSDPQARQQLAEAQAELRLARAEREYAEKLLAEVKVRARKDGVVIYSDRSDWIRRPVKTGQKVMEIADPRRLALRISLPVADSIVIREGGAVRVFLDADPLEVIEARVRSASFHAEEMAGGLLAYRIEAEIVDAGNMAERLRIGFRGSAQVIGDRAPLGFYLFRRPLAAFRQYFGI